MYLKTFSIRNFRGIEAIDLQFNKGLNILIGENNAGKSTIIDALRLCFSYGEQRRDIYITDSDFHVPKSQISDVIYDIEFHLYFEIEDNNEVAWFNDLLSVHEDGTRNLQMHFRYYKDENERIRLSVWGGTNEGQSISQEVFYLIHHVYLDALRNVTYHLRPRNGSKLGQLYTNIKTNPDHEFDLETKKRLARKVSNSISDDAEWSKHIEKGKSKINSHLAETSFADKQQKIDISFLSFDFRKLVDNLKIQIPIYDDSLIDEDSSIQKYLELEQNGLGYNNLIYTATVLGDLKQIKEKDKESYAALLIEEPEAHLHPQLQNLFFKYFSKLKDDEDFQIFISSHSPTITAKADLDSLIVLQNIDNGVSAIPIKATGLEPENKKYLQKFLDVTKSQLFFSNGVILVEGISEALLMPTLSKIMSEKKSESLELDKNGIEIVNLGNLGFSHFGLLFNNEDNDKNLKTRCAIITDDDRGKNNGEITGRAQNTLDLAGNNLSVFPAEETFEFELFIAGDNKDIMLSVFGKMHPQTVKDIPSSGDIKDRARAFVRKLESNKAKSEFALQLSIKLDNEKEERDKFTVPKYIERAIEYVIKGEIDV